jgi:uncharacterized protein (DUF1684 family)
MTTTETPSDATWTERIEQSRRDRIQYFRDHPRSPLPPDLRGESFPGLAYYQPDPDFRFVVPLHEHDDPTTVTVSTTAENEQTYERYGEFRFELAGEERTLQAYRPTDGGDRLWVPFRDDTNGEETYGAGRYIDLQPDEHRTDGGWVLDFNTAYNPTCAYNHAYECPLVPMENWLSVPIEAGEKDFPAEPVDPHEHR